MSDAQPAAVAPAKKGKSKLLLIIVALIVLLGGGGAGAWWYMGKKAEAAPAEEASTPPGFITLDPFIVNLADPGGRRFLRISLRPLVKSEAEAKESKSRRSCCSRRVRPSSSCSRRRCPKSSRRPRGKTELKKQIAERATAAFGGHTEVTDVLFAEFVVQ